MPGPLDAGIAALEEQIVQAQEKGDQLLETVRHAKTQWIKSIDECHADSAAAARLAEKVQGAFRPIEIATQDAKEIIAESINVEKARIEDLKFGS